MSAPNDALCSCTNQTEVINVKVVVPDRESPRPKIGLLVVALTVLIITTMMTSCFFMFICNDITETDTKVEISFFEIPSATRSYPLHAHTNQRFTTQPGYVSNKPIKITAVSTITTRYNTAAPPDESTTVAQDDFITDKN